MPFRSYVTLNMRHNLCHEIRNSSFSGNFYAGDSFWGDIDKLLSFMFTGMKKHNLKEVMMTILRMERKNLTTKEKNGIFLRGKKVEERIGQ